MQPIYLLILLAIIFLIFVTILIMKLQKKIPSNINLIEILVLVSSCIFFAFFITCASAALGPPFFRLMDYNVTSTSITDIDATSGLPTSFVAVIVGYLFYELTTGNQPNKSTISTDNGTMQCNYLQTEKSSPDTLKCGFCCKKSGYFTKPVKNITNGIFICHKPVNNDTKSNSYSLKRQ